MSTATTSTTGNLPEAKTAPATASTSAPLKGATLALGSIALALATFMNVLDSSIANVSIPAISGDLGVSPDQGTWVITSFGVSNAIALPLTGWLTQRYGQVRLFTASVFLFVIASILCALAPSIAWLIVFRILQGAVAGPMIPLSQSLLLSTYPKEKSGTALGLWSMTTMAAPVAGPLLGGWITDNISWPWIFYINVPVGIFAGAVTWAIYRQRETPTVKLPIDGVGLGLLMVWVGSLQILLDKGQDLDWFHSTEIVTLAIVALFAFLTFIVWELTDKHPIVDLRLLKKRNFWVAALALSLGYGAFFGNIVLLPLWMQQYMGYTATAAGLVLAPVGIMAILLTPVVGKNLHRADLRWFASGTFAVFAVVFFMRSHFSTDADFAALMAPTWLQGVSMSLFFVPLLTIAFSGLSSEQIPAASGLSNFMRVTAGSFGVSIATAGWAQRANLHHAQLTEHITQLDPAAAQALSAAGLSPEQGYGLVNRMIDQQAFTLAANDVFHVTAVLFVLLIALVWLAKPKGSADGAAAASGAH